MKEGGKDEGVERKDEGERKRMGGKDEGRGERMREGGG